MVNHQRAGVILTTAHGRWPSAAPAYAPRQLAAALVTSLATATIAVAGPPGDEICSDDDGNGVVCFFGLGDLPGGIEQSQALGVSDAGNAAVGIGATDLATEGFRWTADAGMNGIGLLLGGSTSRAIALSAEGDVIVGAAMNANGQEVAVRWTEDVGLISLGALPGGVSSTAIAVSDAGDVAVGWTNLVAGSEAMRWTPRTGLVSLGDLPGGLTTSRAVDVSGDGTIIVGTGHSGVNEAFRWTEETGMVGLGFLPGAIVDTSQAFGISQNGEVIVGMSWASAGIEAFRWTEETGMVSIGDLAGGGLSFSFAYDVSADGDVIVGLGETALGGEAFIWNPEDGMRALEDVLQDDYDLDLPGWELAEARGVSADGATIVGWGWHNEVAEAWLIQFPRPCAGDLDADFTIGPADLAIILEAWGSGDLNADLNLDGLVDSADLAQLLAAWGPCSN